MATNPLDIAAGSLSVTGMRYHELALQQWLNSTFLIRWGAPVPVVFSSPMDAFAEYTRLWGAANNPYRYLLDLKDSSGAPLYSPYPAQVKYPVISVYRRNYKLRQSHNFSINRMRNIAWVSTSDNNPKLYGKDQQGVNLQMGDVGNVVTSRYPLALDYRFQIDFFCNRPDTQAYMLSQLYNEFWRTGGTTLQTWTTVNYPVIGPKLVRLYIDGDVENVTPETPEDGKNVEFRVSFNVVLEGYEIDVRYKVEPTLWEVLFGTSAVSLKDLAAVGVSPSQYNSVNDMRGDYAANSELVYRSTIATIPANGTYAPDTNPVG